MTAPWLYFFSDAHTRTLTDHFLCWGLLSLWLLEPLGEMRCPFTLVFSYTMCDSHMLKAKYVLCPSSVCVVIRENRLKYWRPQAAENSCIGQLREDPQTLV